ncbi:spondin domain-containing protein [Planctomycetota bacterium]
MKSMYYILTMLLLSSIVTTVTLANESASMRAYQVTIENLSAGQALTPPLVVTHTGELQLYQVGEAASSAIQAIAENGDLGPLVVLFTITWVSKAVTIC